MLMKSRGSGPPNLPSGKVILTREDFDEEAKSQAFNFS
jgi:hypothetical protein